MVITKNTPLSMDGSYEQIVNSGTRARRSLTSKWVGKILKTIVMLLAVLLVNILLWLFNVIPSVPSIYVSEIITCAVAFLAGRLYEVAKR